MTQTQKAAWVVAIVPMLAMGCAKTDKPEAVGGAAASGGEPKVEAPRPAEVTLKTVKYKELGEAIKAEKGNVVLVDVWATYCIPCKREFPNFVKLHEDRAKDGLVCLSVSVDDKENRDAAEAYLKKQNATTTNFWLDEPSDVWGKHWEVKGGGVPLAFVFNREGKLVKKFENVDPDPKAPGFTYEEVTKVVDELLKKSSF